MLFFAVPPGEASGDLSKPAAYQACTNGLVAESTTKGSPMRAVKNKNTLRMGWAVEACRSGRRLNPAWTRQATHKTQNTIECPSVHKHMPSQCAHKYPSNTATSTKTR